MASEGGKGLAKKMYGRGAEDIILEVPVGTVIFDANTNELLCDLSTKGQTYFSYDEVKHDYYFSYQNQERGQLPLAPDNHIEKEFVLC